MKVEYLRANENGTWDTVVADVPVTDRTDDAAIMQWATENLAPQAQHRRIVLWAIYSIPEDDA